MMATTASRTNSPSPHFRFPSSPSPTSIASSPSHQHQKDYFSFDSTKHRVTNPLEAATTTTNTSTTTTTTTSTADIGAPHRQTSFFEQSSSKTSIPSTSDFAQHYSPPHPHLHQLQNQHAHKNLAPTHSKVDSISSTKSFASSNGSQLTLIDQPFFSKYPPQMTETGSKQPLTKFESTDTLFEIAHPQYQPQQPQQSFSALKPPRLASSYSSASTTSSSSSLNRTPTSATDSNFAMNCSPPITSNSTNPTPTRPQVRHAISLSHDFTMMSRLTTNRLNKDMIHLLPQNTNFMTQDTFYHYMTDSPQSSLIPSFIVIDVRPFGEFCKSHIRCAVNICLSSTLLKRSSFDLKRCLDSLPAADKQLFSSHFNSHSDIESLPAVVLYDSCSELENKLSSSLALTAQKFAQDKEWNSSVFVLQGGFQEFQKKFPQAVTSFDNNNTNSNNNTADNSNISETSSDQYFSSPTSSINSLGSISLQQQTRTQSKQMAAPPAPSFLTKTNSASPILSRFVLPSPSNAVFKTRHCDELLTSRPDSSIFLHESQFMTAIEQSKLPRWMASTIGSDNGSKAIAEKFNYLEVTERDRLRKCFSIGRSSSNTDEQHVVASGVEMGTKNRYKDILPYEHSRVKLDNRNDINGNDYINASYISSTLSSKKYIATQGPLKDTIGDFWSLVISQKASLIISLTAQSEGGVEKCAPFWEPGHYNGGVKVELIELEKNFHINDESKSPMTLRRLRITLNGITSHEILQIQVVSWPDYGATIDKTELLSLVSLKNSLLKNLKVEENPIVVHCSAGCGRTGTFCAIDSTIDHILHKRNTTSAPEDERDPVLKIVDSFRRQRISMVQTMTQYLLIYDTVLSFLRTCNVDHNSESKIISSSANTSKMQDEVFWDNVLTMTNKNNTNDQTVDILVHYINNNTKQQQ